MSKDRVAFFAVLLVALSVALPCRAFAGMGDTWPHVVYKEDSGGTRRVLVVAADGYDAAMCVIGLNPLNVDGGIKSSLKDSSKCPHFYNIAYSLFNIGEFDNAGDWVPVSVYQYLPSSDGQAWEGTVSLSDIEQAKAEYETVRDGFSGSGGGDIGGGSGGTVDDSPSYTFTMYPERDGDRTFTDSSGVVWHTLPSKAEDKLMQPFDITFTGTAAQTIQTGMQRYGSAFVYIYSGYSQNQFSYAYGDANSLMRVGVVFCDTLSYGVATKTVAGIDYKWAKDWFVESSFGCTLSSYDTRFKFGSGYLNSPDDINVTSLDGITAVSCSSRWQLCDGYGVHHSIRYPKNMDRPVFAYGFMQGKAGSAPSVVDVPEVEQTVNYYDEDTTNITSNVTNNTTTTNESTTVYNEETNTYTTTNNYVTNTQVDLESVTTRLDAINNKLGQIGKDLNSLGNSMIGKLDSISALVADLDSSLDGIHSLLGNLTNLLGYSLGYLSTLHLDLVGVLDAIQGLEVGGSPTDLSGVTSSLSGISSSLSGIALVLDNIRADLGGLDRSTDDLPDLTTIETGIATIVEKLDGSTEQSGVDLSSVTMAISGTNARLDLLLQKDFGSSTDLGGIEKQLDEISSKLDVMMNGTPEIEPREVGGGGEQTIGEQVGAKVEELSRRFPFSLPWDVQFVLSLLVREPVAPVFDLPVIGSDDSVVHVDLSDWEPVAKVCRQGTLILFALGLALRTRQLVSSWGSSGD